MRLTSILDLEVEGALLLEQEAWNLVKIYDDLFENYPNDDRECGIHATELNTCLRQVVYTLTCVKKVHHIAAMWRKKFQVGHAFHDMIQDHFAMLAERSGGRITFEKEVRVQDTPIGRELCLTSSCDGIFTFWDDNGVPYLRVAVEIKSKSPKEYEKMKGPEEKHVEQAHLYMKALDIPLVWVFYWNKGTEGYTPSVAPFLVRFNEAIWNKLEARARLALDMAERHLLPDREESMSCVWCPYTHTCNPPSQKKFEPRVHLPIRR